MLLASNSDPSPQELPPWQNLRAGELWRWPLPEVPSALDRFLIRLVGRLALAGIRDIDGWKQIQPRHDPFLLVANHSSRREAVLLPAILLLARDGRPVRFLADWNFRLIPGVGRLYDHGGAITVTRKDAKPRVLNRLKPLFLPAQPAHEEARRHLMQGGAVGIFPEGTVNRDGARLLRGCRGAARLSLEIGVPVVPVGIHFARRDAVTGKIDSSSPMRIRFGGPMRPPPADRVPPSLRSVTDWHGELMTAIAALCGKDWPGTARAGNAQSSPYRFAQASEEAPNGE